MQALKYIFLCYLTISICFIKHASAQTANPSQYKYVFTVAKDGSGDFKFIQEAIDAMLCYPLAPITLYIKNGVYTEKIELPSTNTDVTFIGQSVDSTIITFSDYAGRGKHNTFTSFTAKISGNRFTAINITFTNTAGRVGQALALYVDADKAVFKNCKFIGNQDTIFLGGETSRQYFDSCYIEGTVDFIFGPATAIFNSCLLRCKQDSYITAASTPKNKPFGFVFLNCRIKADTSVTELYLGRPWRAYAKTVFINCELPAAIMPEGWDHWGNPENEKTVFYAEYKSKGERVDPAKRTPWSKQLTDAEAKAYTVENIFKTDTAGVQSQMDWFRNTARPFVWNNKK